jgi:site-specific DNA-methyltransferase (adenine-specific)
MTKKETVGWRPTCDHAGAVVPCVVLDPFSGSATTGDAAMKHGARYIGIDLLPSNNTELAEPRLLGVLEGLKKPEDVELLVPGIFHGDSGTLLHRVRPESVRLVLSDPPYNTSRQNNFDTMGREGIDFDWDGDFDQEEWVRLADKALMPWGSMVIWNDWKILGLVAHLLIDLGYDVKRNLLWKKTNPMPRNTGRSAVQRTEMGLWAVKPGPSSRSWVFNKNPNKPYEDFVFDYGVPRAKDGRPRHQAKKPDGMFAEIIMTLTEPGDLVLDPFAGGGTTPWAAKATGRECIAFEQMEAWYNEAVLHTQEAPTSFAWPKPEPRAAEEVTEPEEVAPPKFRHVVRLKTERAP